MRSEEWGRLTPRLFLARLDRHEALQRRMDLRFGILASLIHNANRGQNTPAMEAEDFFPGS